MEPRGHINVHVEPQSAGAGVNWLIFDQSRAHVESKSAALISPTST
jgi:hypothetical protein